MTSHVKIRTNNKTRKTTSNKDNKFYDIFWNFLLSKKIKRVFGLPGGPIDNLLSKKPNHIIWTNAGNELQNGFISQIYGHYTNNVGYLFTSTGPGIATAISALENAIYEGNPLILVSALNSNDNIGDFQTWNIKDISTHLTKHVFYIENKNDIVSIMQESYDTAKKYNTGVILLFESKLFTEKIYKIPKKQIIQPNNKIAILETLNLTNILLIIGKLKIDDYIPLIKFIKANNLPFVTTWKGRFSIRKYMLACGRIGTHGKHSANYALYHASHLLVLGNVSGLLQKSYGNKFAVIFTKDKNIVSLCYNKEHTIQTKHIYEVNNLSDIFANLNIETNNNWILQLKNANSILNVDLPRISKLEEFTYIASLVYKNNKLDIPVTTDIGNQWYAIGKYMDTEEPNCFESATTWASIGTGISNGIGIHYATNKQVWVFVGDGGTLFSSSDLLYLLNNPQLPITVTIYVNHIYGAIFEDFKIKQDKFNDVIKVPNIPILKILPNCHFFNDTDKYHHYLHNHCYCNKLRFIIISIPNTILSNSVYEINVNVEYEQNLKNSMFTNILNTEMIL